MILSRDHGTHPSRVLHDFRHDRPSGRWISADPDLFNLEEEDGHVAVLAIVDAGLKPLHPPVLPSLGAPSNEPRPSSLFLTLRRFRC